MSADDYCRGLEAHLTRRNDGHLIRIVGPAFEMVRGWFDRGVPFKVACHGIDRTMERYYAKGPRRRPVRIEYCEADVLDAFDEWRRAVGVRTSSTEESIRPKRAGLGTAIRRAIGRITALRGSAAPPLVAADVLDDAVRKLDALASRAERARGTARAEVVAELDALDAALLAEAERALDPVTRQELESQAETDLAPFRDRMPAASFRAARTAAFTQLLRAQVQLPTLSGLGGVEESEAVAEGDTDSHD